MESVKLTKSCASIKKNQNHKTHQITLKLFGKIIAKTVYVFSSYGRHVGFLLYQIVQKLIIIK